MNTLQFVAAHNGAPVSEAAAVLSKMYRIRALSLFNDSLRAEEQSRRAAEMGDEVRRVWFEAHSEWLAEKSDDNFAKALQAARGAL